MKASKTPSKPPACGEQVILVVHERGRIKGTTTEVDGRFKEAGLEAAGRSE